jgi:hypothetical protein
MKFTQFYTFIEAYMPYLASKPMFCNLFFPTAHPNLTMAPEGTPQNLALWRGGTK